MKVSRTWLQNFLDGQLPTTQGVSDALTFHAFEIDGIENVAGDDVLDVKITANRGHDCMSHRGIAKELSAILNIPLVQKYDPFNRPLDASKKTDSVSVSIESDKCNRYIAAVIRGVKVGPSPDWLKKGLEAIGQRSINNVVDATNLVMFNIGQPLHAFDMAKAGNKIVVRQAKAGEKILALDNKEYTLAGPMLVIASESQVLGIAGVKGGKFAEVNEQTTDIILEAANFDGPSVRKTARALKLRTDASARFEQVLSPELASYGMQQAIDLITQAMGGTLEGIVDVYPRSRENKPVSVSATQVRQVLGDEFGTNEIEDAFKRLSFSYEKNGETYTVTPPFERLDLEIPEDLIEEVGRIIGYDRVPAKDLPPFPKTPAVNKNFYYAEKIRQFLTERGFSEIFTSVFADEGKREVLNKVDSDKPFLRDSLLPGMNVALEKNSHVTDLLGLPDVRLFEIGVVFDKNGERTMLAIGSKGNKKTPKPQDVLTELLQALGGSAKAEQKDNAVQVDFGALVAKLPEPSAYEDFSVSTLQRYQPYSKYPYIMRDIAMWMPAGRDLGEVLEAFSFHNKGLLRNAILFDQYQKDGRTSYAFHLAFQSFEKTLQDEEVNAIMENIYADLRGKGYEIR